MGGIFRLDARREYASVHLVFDVTRPPFGIAFGIEGFTGNRLAFPPDSGFPLQVAALPNACHFTPPFDLSGAKMEHCFQCSILV